MSSNSAESNTVEQQASLIPGQTDQRQTIRTTTRLTGIEFNLALRLIPWFGATIRRFYATRRKCRSDSHCDRHTLLVRSATL